MSTYAEQISEALMATSLNASGQFNWFGRAEGRLPKAIGKAVDKETARAHVLSRLQQRLYASFYCCGLPRRDRDGVAEPGPSGSPEFVRALAEANAGQGGEVSGWTVRARQGDNLVIQREGLLLTAPIDRCLPCSGTEIRPGETVKVRFPAGQFGISPGHYMALSDAEFPSRRSAPRLRIYWHVTPEAAPQLMAEITRRLNDLRLPFRFKVLNDPQRFTRCDAAVLYLLQSDYGRALDAVVATCRAVARGLGSTVPALTKPLLPGLGLAEDPQDGGSFGMQRCGVLADGIIRAHEGQARTLAERLSMVIARFSDEGINVDTPYLNPGSEDVYSLKGVTSADLQVTANADRPNMPAEVGDMAPNLERSRYLQTAHTIAYALAETAYWHGERCTWLARVVSGRHSPGNAPGTYEVLDPTMYCGTAGVALFLATVTSLTEDRDLARTAAGAMRQALARLDDVPDTDRPGLHSGWLGIALCAARTGELLDMPRFVQAARSLVRRSAKAHKATREFDVMSGLSGGILALAAVHKLLGASQCLHIAQAWGDELLEMAEPAAFGNSWRAPHQARHQRNLTGYSHGTAGVVHALLELYAISGDERYRRTAERGLEYERHWFSAEARNWPDFRGDKDVFMCAWCHGAPGIALSRLRAYEVLGDAAVKAEAGSALSTTREQLQHWFDTGIADPSLCHGLAGNADILLAAAQLLADEGPPGTPLAQKAARALIAFLDLDRRNALRRVTDQGPGLMVGLAGSGYALLRHYDSHVPSPLYVRSGWCDGDRPPL